MPSGYAQGEFCIPFDIVVGLGSTHTEEQMRRYLGLKNGGNYIIRGFIICNYRQYMSGDKTNVDVMDGNIHSYRRLV
jgi:hypothetical protein